MDSNILATKKIAVVGSGISGLSCAWMLSKQHQVTLFEKDDRLGGHSHTVDIRIKEQDVAVDTGFIVYNPLNYPNLVALFNHLGVESCETDMSFSVSVDQGHMEYSGSGLAGLFAQKRNLLRPGFWRMLSDIRKFYQSSEHLLQTTSPTLSLRELLSDLRYSDEFIYQHLVPMGAAIWSTPVDKMLDYPALGFLRFCQNHGLLQVNDRPQWRTLPGGSIRYVNKLAEDIKDIRLNHHIHQITREEGGVKIWDRYGQAEQFDEVVLACHSDQALKLLAQPSKQEQQLLSCFRYQRNQAFLHTDPKLMPARRSVWASWNYLSDTRSAEDQQSFAVTYWMNQLQPLNIDTPVLVTLNPDQPPGQDHFLRSYFYDHPVFDSASFEAQPKLWSLQGQQHTWFCGAYFGYGFHEDGLQAGLAVAEQLGRLNRPWSLDSPSHRIHVNKPAQSIVQPGRKSYA